MIYIYREGSDCYLPWAEVMDGFPVHPGELLGRVRQLIASGVDWATQSDIVISMLGWMVRTGELNIGYSITYVEVNGVYQNNKFCSDGRLLYEFPESIAQFSILSAEFYYRNAK